jgi:hypothetical protein
MSSIRKDLFGSISPGNQIKTGIYDLAFTMGDSIGDSMERGCITDSIVIL